LTRLRDAVRDRGNTIGIAWDGDGDRAAFIDEEGNYISPDEVAILFAREALSGMPHGRCKVVVDLKHSDVVRRAVLEAGGLPLLERTGHAFMRGRMLAESALLGLDACGHYFFQELEGGDDGLFSALYLLDLVHRSGRPLHELRTALPPIFSTPELRIPSAVLEFDETARTLERAFPEASATHTDGLRLLLPQGVVLIRESGTEPVLSLRIEGFDHSAYERIHTQCLSALPALAAFLLNQPDIEPTT
jgi:phosphomannomutase